MNHPTTMKNPNSPTIPPTPDPTITPIRIKKHPTPQMT